MAFNQTLELRTRKIINVFTDSLYAYASYMYMELFGKKEVFLLQRINRCLLKLLKAVWTLHSARRPQSLRKVVTESDLETGLSQAVLEDSRKLV